MFQARHCRVLFLYMIDQNIPVLIDFDGVIKLGDDIAEDAKDFFIFLKQNNIPFFLLSNSTLRTSEGMLDFIKRRGIDFDIAAMTAVDATLHYIKEYYKRVTVYCRENLKPLFSEFDTKENPEAVVLGDIAENWTYDTMNKIFRTVINRFNIFKCHFLDCIPEKRFGFGGCCFRCPIEF